MSPMIIIVVIVVTVIIIAKIIVIVMSRIILEVEVNIKSWRDHIISYHIVCVMLCNAVLRCVVLSLTATRVWPKGRHKCVIAR